jgi:hypothetical protein
VSVKHAATGGAPALVVGGVGITAVLDGAVPAVVALARLADGAALGVDGGDGAGTLSSGTLATRGTLAVVHAGTALTGGTIESPALTCIDGKREK